jgi:selenocysteine lyase/cysteine desulfurase
MPSGPPPARRPELLRFRDEFPLLSASVYLNTCSLGARSTRSGSRLREVLEQWDRLGARAWYGHWLDELAALRDDFGWTIGVPGDQIALAPNVSTALATIASALDPIHRGDTAALDRLRAAGLPLGASARPKVITTELDFPTLGHQWLARTALGVEVEILPSPDGLTIPIEAFAAAVDDRTALVATGHVYFTTGAAVDVGALASLCRQRGALLLIDAYQATGLLPTDVAELGVDLYVSGSLKWLFGGSGSAFLWVRPELGAALDPTTTGWFSAARQFAFEIGTLEYASDGRKFELGTPSIPSAAVARGGLAVVREIGIEAIAERTLYLGDRLIGLADAASLRVRAVRDPGRRGGIVAIEVANPKPVVDELAARGVVVDYRPGVVRISPAFYNTEEELALAVAAVDELIPASDRP